VSETVIYPARRIITMNPALPTAEAVAVRGDRVLGVGTIDELDAWGAHRVDTMFADLVLTPGFIEAHSHAMAGGMWHFTYVGFFDRRDPSGQVWHGCKGIDDVLDRLGEAESMLDDRSAPLLAWGLDPIYFEGERLVARHLDMVSEHRPIFVYHASGHLATVNSAMLAVSEITSSSTTPGVVLGGDGMPNGELQEPAAMSLATLGWRTMGLAFSHKEAKWSFAAEARNGGHTMVTDLGTSPLTNPKAVAAWHENVNDPDYPSRVMVAVGNAFGGDGDPTELAQLTTRLRAQSTDKLHFGIVKLILDGSIQGFTARLEWPYYLDPPKGHPGNGLWLIPPEQMADIVTAYHQAGITVHCHCNGDQATQVFIDAVATALERSPRWDHRHTVQHCQLTTPAQYRRMAAMGMAANIFSNHIFYWGDQHRDITVGAERAAGMDACATALASGVRFSIHSDAPITPMGQLHTAWCAVNRQTASGQTLGLHERISVADALRAITIDAAWQLNLDHTMGSVEIGKYADFAVLGEDPLEVDPMTLKDIDVWGTVLGGRPFEAGHG
jgi:predicted amidohydrolase YtcJ